MQSKIIKLIYIVFLLFISMQSVATSRVDSLVSETERMNNSEEKVLLLLEIADSLVSIETIESLKYAQQALSNTQKLNYKKGLGLAHYQIAKAEYYRDEYDSALKSSKEAVKVFQAINEELGIARAYYLTGNIYSYQGDLEN